MRYERLGDLLRLAFTLAGTREGRTIDEVALEFGVSRRTAERMLDVVRTAFPQIEEAPSDDRRKRWRLPQNAMRSLLVADAKELVELDAAARRLRMDGDAVGRASTLEHLGAKLRAALQTDVLRRTEPDVALLMESEGTALRPGPRPVVASPLLDDIRSALLKSQRIRLVHRAAGPDGKERERIVEPLGVLYGSRPYLVARLVGYPPGPSLLRLDRIRQLEVLDETFLRDETFDLQAYAARSFGVFQEPAITVCLRFSADVAADVKAFHFHPTQRLETLSDGRILVHFAAGGRLEMMQHFATWGDCLEILEPAHLREDLAAWSRDLADHHRKTPNSKWNKSLHERMARSRPAGDISQSGGRSGGE